MPQDLFCQHFQLRAGQRCDRTLLLTLMQRTYQETYPQCQGEHLEDAMGRYWSPDAPAWFVTLVDQTQTVACLWLGRAVDPVSGETYTHVLLLYVFPEYRCRGLGTALMQKAEDWARQQGDRKIGLQVFEASKPAQLLYRQLGYSTYARTLIKPLPEN
ncbi:MAG: GNAT family N-acetyltransferase [Thermosynechococcaceae cyanobacterium]